MSMSAPTDHDLLGDRTVKGPLEAVYVFVLALLAVFCVLAAAGAGYEPRGEFGEKNAGIRGRTRPRRRAAGR